MATVSDRDLDALRAWLRDELRAMSWHVVNLSITRPRGKGLSNLAYAAFGLATARRFSPVYTRRDVVRFVVRARTDHCKLTGEFDPLLAEYVIVQGLGGKVSGAYGRVRQYYTRLRLLRVLVADLELDTDGLDQLLAKARDLADSWTARQSLR